jgi:hypothetical protein
MRVNIVQSKFKLKKRRRKIKILLTIQHPSIIIGLQHHPKECFLLKFFHPWELLPKEELHLS